MSAVLRLKSEEQTGACVVENGLHLRDGHRHSQVTGLCAHRASFLRHYAAHFTYLLLLILRELLRRGIMGEMKKSLMGLSHVLR